MVAPESAAAILVAYATFPPSAPAGSQAHWLGGDERQELIAEDVEAGLLT